MAGLVEILSAVYTRQNQVHVQKAPWLSVKCTPIKNLHLNPKFSPVGANHGFRRRAKILDLSVNF